MVERLDTEEAALPAADPEEALRETFDRLSRYEAAREDIEEAYDTTVMPYIDTMADLRFFNANKEDHRQFVEDVLRTELHDLGLGESLQLSVGEPVPVGQAVHQVRATISFESGSDQQALAGLFWLGHVQAGSVWETFSVRADAKQQVVLVNGQLSVIVVDPAE